MRTVAICLALLAANCFAAEVVQDGKLSKGGTFPQQKADWLLHASGSAGAMTGHAFLDAEPYVLIDITSGGKRSDGGYSFAGTIADSDDNTLVGINVTIDIDHNGKGTVYHQDGFIWWLIKGHLAD